MSCRRELDWVAKLRAPRGLPQPRRPRLVRTRGCSSSTCSTPTCGPTRASTTGSSARGRMERLADRGRGRTGADRSPPEDTRAYFRGRCLRAVRRRGRGGLLGLGDLRPPGRESLQRVPTLEPLRGTKAHVGAAPGPLPHRRRPGGRPDRRGLTRALYGSDGRASSGRLARPLDSVTIQSGRPR